MESDSKQTDEKTIGKTLVIYLGSAWVFIEAFNFIIDKYRLDAAILDIIILLVIFGLPASVIYASFKQQFTTKAIIFQSINLIIAIGVISYDQISPNVINPTEIRLLNFKSNQQKLAESIRSIAILPFSNLTGNPEKKYLSAGIHDAIISEMGQVGAIRVTSRTSTLQYNDTEKTIQQIASELDVDAIIEGSVLLVDTIIRVQVKLMSAYPEELQLWTHTYDTPLNDLLKVYGDMTMSIVQEINVALSSEEQSLLTESKTVNADAYEAYLKGKYSMGLLSKEGIEAAMGYFMKAIELDPEFASAHAGLGGIWAFLKQMDFVSSDEANPHIIANLNKALELDSTLADTYYWDAVKKIWTDYDWEAGEKSFKKALSLNPNFSEARGLYSNYLICEGRWSESENQMSKALEVDPNNPFIRVLQGMLYLNEEKYDSLIPLYTAMQKNMPTNPLLNLGLFIAYYQTENLELALEQTKLKLELEGHKDFIKLLEQEYERSGYKKSLERLAFALESQDTLFFSAQSIQCYYAIAGNEDKTMDWIEKGFIRKDPDMPVIAVNPLLKPYKDNNRYKEMVKKMNLPLNKYYTSVSK